MFKDLDSMMADPRFQSVATSYANLSPEMRAILGQTSPLDDEYQKRQLQLLELATKKKISTETLALKKDQGDKTLALGKEKNAIAALNNATRTNYMKAVYGGTENRDLTNALGVGSALVAAYGAKQKMDLTNQLLNKGKLGLSAYGLF